MTLLPFMRTKSFVTIVWLVVALQLFNISFDPPDHSSEPEDLSINELESCLELVLELVLGHEDAIKESDESDEATDKPCTSVILFSNKNSSLLAEYPIIYIKNYQPIFKSAHIESLSLPITSPPPKLL